MKKIIIFTIIAIITFSWLVTHNTTESEKIPPANTPFIIKSNVPGMVTGSFKPSGLFPPALQK